MKSNVDVTFPFYVYRELGLNDQTGSDCRLPFYILNSRHGISERARLFSFLQKRGQQRPWPAWPSCMSRPAKLE